MDRFVRGVTLLSQICGVFAAGLLAASVVIVCEMVFIRYVLNQNTIWQTDFVTWSLVAATFVGSPYLLLSRGHVNVDVLPHYLGPRARLDRDVACLLHPARRAHRAFLARGVGEPLGLRHHVAGAALDSLQLDAD